MAYDDADNAGMPWSSFTDADGHVLYVVDTASVEADGSDAYVYTEDGNAISDVAGYPSERDARFGGAAAVGAPGGDIAYGRGSGRRWGGGDDDLGDSLSALFLAYDAAVDDAADGAGQNADVDGRLVGSPQRAGHASPGPRVTVRRDDVGAYGTQNEGAQDRQATRRTRHLTPRRERGRTADPDVDAMSALMDALDLAEESQDMPDLASVSGVAEPTAPASRPPAMSGHDVTIVPPRHDEIRHWNDTDGVSLAVDDMAAHSPEAEAAVDALRVRRAQTRRRHGAYAFMAIGALLVTLAAVFVNYLLGLDEALDAVAGGTAVVTRADFKFTAVGEGTLEGATTAAVPVGVSGKVTQVYVAEGDLVEEGDILFSVENDALMDAADAASARLERANDALRQANEAVTAAYESYNAEVDSYRAGRNPSFDEPALLAAIRSAEIARDSALAEANEARDALEAANDQAAARDVVAPASGAVTAIRVVPGDMVEPSDGDGPSAEAPMQIADLSKLHALVSVSGEAAQDVAVGESALVSLAALPDVTSNAVVKSVAPVSGRSSDGASSVVADLEISHPDSRLRPGAELSVVITTKVSHDALVVPLQAVRVEEDGSYVWVVTDDSVGMSERRAVSVVGVDTQAGTTMVLDGLAEGDEVGLP